VTFPDFDSGPKYDRVELGSELARILTLPRRPPPAAPLPDNPTPEDLARVAEIDELCRTVTRALARHPDPYPVGKFNPYTGKTNPRNTGFVNAVQAMGLQELWLYNGIFGPIRPGGGKTLLFALSCTVRRARRPLYVCPASLQEEAAIEFERYAEHWHTPRPQIIAGTKGVGLEVAEWEPGTVKIISYQLLSRKTRRDEKGQPLHLPLLLWLGPDHVMFDECHYTSNLLAAVSRKVRRWRYANPNVPFLDMSGTMMREGIGDYAHLAEWSMPLLCPVPRHDHHLELAAWGDALDERDSFGPRKDIGELIRLCSDQEKAKIDELRSAGQEDEVRGVVRCALGRRIIETPGCVATQDGPLGIPVSIDHVLSSNPDPAIDSALSHLRNLWELPNGQPIADGLEMYRHARTMGLGFWQTWDPPPPDEWLVARKEWKAWSRERVRYNRRELDSEDEIKDAVRAKVLFDEGRLAAWEAVEHTYDPEQHVAPVWVSDELLHTVAAWLDVEGRQGAIIWVQDVEVGGRLSSVFKLPYYAEHGRGLCGELHPES
jgi:hypothetical protein